jgi:hypothetical protein
LLRGEQCGQEGSDVSFEPARQQHAAGVGGEERLPLRLQLGRELGLHSGPGGSYGGRAVQAQQSPQSSVVVVPNQVALEFQQLNLCRIQVNSRDAGRSLQQGVEHVAAGPANDEGVVVGLQLQGLVERGAPFPHQRVAQLVQRNAGKLGLHHAG